MKYLKTYENYINWFNFDKTKLYCGDRKLTKLPELPDSLEVLYFYDNPLEELPENIDKSLLRYNREKWIKENVIKWIINKPSDYKLLRRYLTEEQINSYNENGIQGLKKYGYNNQLTKLPELPDSLKWTSK